MKVQRAILLLGGLGTRLRPFTLVRPKPLLPILGRPMISYQVEQLRGHGVKEVVLALGHKAGHFQRFLGTGKKWGVKFIYSPETEPLGTGGAIRLAARWVKGPTLILNGDVLSDLDLPAFMRFHARNRADATLALTPVPDPSAFGLIETEKDGRIRSFLEKPSPDQITTNTINAGFYLFEPSVFAHIPEGRAVSVEREVFPSLLGRGSRLYGYRHEGYWSDVGTLRAYHATHGDLLGQFKAWSARFRFGARAAGKGVWALPGASIHPSATLAGTIFLGRGARVEEGAVLRGMVCAGDGAVIGAGAAVSDSVLHAGVRVGAGAQVEQALVGEKARLGAGCRVGPGAAVAPGSVWGDHSQPFLPAGRGGK